MSYGQWNKVSKLLISNLIPPPESTYYTITFPTYLTPVSDGHIFVAFRYKSGPGSGSITTDYLFETFDDFSSNSQLTLGGLLISFSAKNDSLISWTETKLSPDIPPPPYNNKFTNDDFQTINSGNKCYSYYTPPKLLGNCLTDNYIYSFNQVWPYYNDTLIIGRSDISNATNYCNYLTNYNHQGGYANTSVLKSLNDSLVFFNCVDKSMNPKNILLKTIDYGQTWNEIYVDSVNSIVSYNFTSELIGYILLSDGSLVKSADGGNTWSILSTPSTDLTCFSFYNDSLGYVGGNQGFLSKTIDGGQTWTNEISGSNYSLIQLFAVSDSVAYFQDSVLELYKNKELYVSIEDYKYENRVSIFPNPTSSIINVNTINKNSIITIFDSYGKEIYRKSLNDKLSKIDCSSFAQGIYFVRLNDKNSVTTTKLIIRR